MWAELLPVIMSGLFSGSLVGGGAAWYNAKQSKLARVAGDERDARRDMITDRDSMLDRVTVRLNTLESRLDQRDKLVEDLYDHINILEDHIWKGRQPPPPPRPVDS